MEEGENLACEWEINNPHDSYTVIVLSIPARCLAVSLLYEPQVCVFALASHFLTDKTCKFSC